MWWAWVCARKASGAKPEPPVKTALEATERWIIQPSGHATFEDGCAVTLTQARAIRLALDELELRLAGYSFDGSTAKTETEALP